MCWPGVLIMYCMPDSNYGRSATVHLFSIQPVLVSFYCKPCCGSVVVKRGSSRWSRQWRHRTIRLMAASVHLLPNRCLVTSGHSPLHTATWPPHQPHRPSPGHVWCTDGENSAILTSILSASYGPFYRVFREGHYSGIYNSSFEK